MIRHTLQAALCIALSPLLVAQQSGQAEESASRATPAGSVFAYRISMLPDESANRADDSGSLYGLSNVPFERAVELTPVDQSAWRNATMGATLRFRVVRNVVVTGGVFNRRSYYADAYAGTLIEGKVIGLRKGRLGTRNGRTEPRVKDILVGKRIKLEMEGCPSGRARFNGLAKGAVVWPVKGMITVGEGVLFMILFPILCHSGCDL